MLTVKKSKRFVKDYKRAIKRGWDLSLLDNVIVLLAKQMPLPPQYKDHKLIGHTKVLEIVTLNQIEY